jgi:hypothetical protein|tara:strand:+ start:1709 stop:1903 length:195 start_codon:yes stop_codon:yes gene_type:complete
MSDLTDIGAMTFQERLDFYKGEGLPPKPEGYDEMSEDNPCKLSYDRTMVINQEQIAELTAKIGE